MTKTQSSIQQVVAFSNKRSSLGCMTELKLTNRKIVAQNSFNTFVSAIRFSISFKFRSHSNKVRLNNFEGFLYHVKK